MREELKPLWTAINELMLPTEAGDLFGDGWDESEGRFRLQETYLIDFKDRVPDRFSDDFGASIVRLSLGLHNSYGGLIVFGVNDGSFTLSGQSIALDIEAFNRTISDFTGKPLECLYRTYRLPGANNDIGVLLIPKRGRVRPLSLNKALGKYKTGMIWLRERHEVLEATPTHLAHLYSGRTTLESGDAEAHALPIHRSLPPSPATMHNFIGRQDLMRELWDWFVFGDQPRMYLHGPGGSGKSTLAFEFAKAIADNGFNIVVPSGDRVDYVLFLSAKETELNPLTGTQQTFSLRQFDDPLSEFKQILFHSGHFDADVVEAADEDRAEEMLEELFSSFTGLLVLDDIDALSRRKVDTGEETLLLKAIGGAGAAERTRILYTQRYPPSYARRNAFEVPGLTGREFYDFLEACCEQFGVAPPAAEIIPIIEDESQSLPLLLETIVGVRRYCGNFQEALDLFRDKGGDDARSYLYQREYDQLDSKGKSREIMATLFLLEEPVHFSTLVNLLGYPPQRVSDALGECGSIFLTTSESETAETLYQLTPPSRPFIRSVSQRLDRFDQIQRKVQLLKAQGGRVTPAEAALIIKMRGALARADFQSVVLVGESLPPHDPCLANPHVLALLGQAYANAAPNFREKARECFRQATALGLQDPAMMRTWFYLEKRSGYGIEEAKRVCTIVTTAERVGPRFRSEFLSKLASCYHQEALALSSVSREKTIPLYQKTIETYVKAAEIAQAVKGMSAFETLNWLERPVFGFIQYLRDDISDFLTVIDNLVARKQDISMEVARILMAAKPKAYIPNDSRTRSRLSGLFRRTSGKLDRFVRESPDYPGLTYIIDTLNDFSAVIIGDGSRKAPN